MFEVVPAQTPLTSVATLVQSFAQSSLAENSPEALYASIEIRQGHSRSTSVTKTCLTTLRRCRGEIKASPRANKKPTEVPEDTPMVLTEEELRKLLDECRGTEWRTGAGTMRLPVPCSWTRDPAAVS